LDIYIARKNRLGNWAEPVCITEDADYDSRPISFHPKNGFYVANKLGKNTDINLINLLENKVADSQKQYGALLPAGIVLPEFCYHPNNEIMYFSANNKKGVGGTDIYLSRFIDNKWEVSELLPKVNSIYNEVNPFVSSDGTKLYFASEGFEQKNMGGFDLFYVDLDDNGLPMGEPINLGYPYNTVFNEISYSASLNYQQIVITSNRLKNSQYDLFFVENESKNGINKDLKVLLVNPNFEKQEAEITGPDGNKFTTLTTNSNVVYIKEPTLGNYTINISGFKPFTFTINENFDSEQLFFIHEPSKIIKKEKTETRGYYWLIEDFEYFSDSVTLVINQTEIKQLSAGIFPFFPFELNNNKYFKVKGIKAQQCIDKKLFLVNHEGVPLREYANLGNCQFGELPDVSQMAFNSSLNDRQNGVVSDSFNSFGEIALDNLNYFQNFEYNVKGGSAAEDALYKSFIYNLTDLLKQNKVAEIKLVGSASKVPTARYANNMELASKRANDLKDALFQSMNESGVDIKKIPLNLVPLVQGPDYKKDAKENQEVYKKYQFAKIEIILKE